MASSKEYMEFILEQLSQAGEVSCRAMMGEYVLYYRGKVIGGIYDDRFLVKNIKAARALMPEAETELPYEGAKEMILVDNVDDREFLKTLLEAMYDELPEPKAKKAKSPDSKQINRIKKYEKMLDEAAAMVKEEQLNEKLAGFIKELEAYYTSKEWKKDFADDEKGRLPKELKRGVLSEDGIYNLLNEYKELREKKKTDALTAPFETERLILRPWKETDAEELYKYAKDPLVGPPTGWPVHTSADNSRQVIKDVLASPGIYAMVLKETGLPVGSIGLHFNSDLAKEDDEAELGFWIGPEYWGRGLTPEASRELLKHAFEELKLESVWCGFYEGNEKSKRAQEKIGFRFHHAKENVPVPLLDETRNEQVNVMTKEDWAEIKNGNEK